MGVTQTFFIGTTIVYDDDDVPTEAEVADKEDWILEDQLPVIAHESDEEEDPTEGLSDSSSPLTDEPGLWRVLEVRELRV